ncbi:hypothetical protein CERSUDRAFT_117255 [Gelatoporia subvermispora B]|uniref:Uncharacterized protein n=1 Tax=Ceriporiopsis subvermispora (strain B) TaxID=914234 RepID=M2R688_CERS8|nr:hypothetical protein CERSUDRAFT_117255 [Gelatoporia subvermispora B]
MAGRKRAAEESETTATAPAEGETTGRPTRAAKARKTERSTSPKARRGGKRGPRANMAAGTFKSRALPLHVNVTHTPPALLDDETVQVANADPGFVGATTLVPTTFSTGTYGWKGSKRLTVELQNGEGEEREKVHVMLTINATVMGSKGAKDEENGETKGEHVADDAAEGTVEVSTADLAPAASENTDSQATDALATDAADVEITAIQADPQPNAPEPAA